MAKTLALAGNEAAAEAMRQINPDVAAVYPITPQTELMHAFAQFHADGAVDTELVLVESEHSAMSATLGASAAGARAMTATSSQGLALMFEIVNIASALRLPIVMPVVNRSISGPINIHCDHSDTMGCRDSGWVQLFSESAQEAYDNTIIAVRVAEHKDVLLPIMVTFDGFIISHTVERVDILEDDQVREFIGTYKPEHFLLDVDNPMTAGPLDLQDYYFEHKRQEIEAQTHVLEVVEEMSAEYAKISGRKNELIELYQMEDAERAIIVMGSTAGTTKEVVDELRAKGEKVGLLKIRVYRPFPYHLITAALKNVKAVAVLDRAVSFGALGGPVYGDIRSALYGNNGHLPVTDYIYGLGGRDIDIDMIKSVYNDLQQIVDTGKIKQEVGYLGLRE